MTAKKTKGFSSLSKGNKILVGIASALVVIGVMYILPDIFGNAPLSTNSIDEEGPIVINGNPNADAIAKENQRIAKMAVLPVNEIPNKVIAIWKDRFDTTVIEGPSAALQNANQIHITSSAHSPVYKPTGYDFYVNYNGGFTLRAETLPKDIESTNSRVPTVESIRKDVSNAYLSYGLKKVSTRNDTIDVYTGRGLVCTIETAGALVAVSTASCGHIRNYEKTAKQVASLAKLLPNTDQTLVIANLAIKKLPDMSEQGTATIGHIHTTDSYTASFFRTSSGDTWQLN